MPLERPACGLFKALAGWLTAQPGRIIFDRPMYAFLLSLPDWILVITVTLVALSLLFNRQHGEDHLVIFIVTNGLVWWGLLTCADGLTQFKYYK